MRVFLVTLLATIVIGAGALPAAADTIQTFTGEIGTETPGRGTSLKLIQKTTETDEGKKPMQVVRAEWKIPAGSVIDSKRGATFCSLKKLRDSGKCSKKSIVGSGRAIFDVRGGSFTQVETEVTAYNASKTGAGTVGRLLLHMAYPDAGVQEIMDGEIKPLSSGPYGYLIRFKEVPSPTFVEGVTSVLTELRVKLRASRKETKKGTTRTYNYFTSPDSCKGKWYFSADLRMANGILLQPLSSDNCKR